MKTARIRKHFRRGFVSYVLVLTTGLTLTILMIGAYKRAISAQVVQSETQIRVDYAEKEDAVLRAIVNIAPNRALRAMQHNSNAIASTVRWQAIFSEALNQANARTSISAEMKTQMGATAGVSANVGDSALGDINAMFDAIEPETGYASTGLNRSLGAGFPPPLQTNGSAAGTNTADRDKLYPIISTQKFYGDLAQSAVGLPVAEYPQFNRILYPEIRFGYSAPGQPFVAKRNWWAFSMQLGENDQLLDSFSRNGGSEGERDFILSIYEIPSQLAISAEAFTSLGAHADGTVWKHASIEGGIYSTRAEIGSGLHLDRLVGRRGLTLGADVTVGDDNVGGDVFAPGRREQFEVATGEFMPVTMASESGRSAFIPINRGKEFFDYYAPSVAESNVLSTTTWDNYSIGARQCAMRLDVTAVVSTANPTPSKLRLKYRVGATGSSEGTFVFDPNDYSGLKTGLYTGFEKVANENETVTFTQPMDVAYGIGSSWFYRLGVTGEFTFNNANFGDPAVGSLKEGWARPAIPCEVKLLHGTRRSIAVYPERFPDFVTSIGGSSPSYNSSLAVNVDYSNSGLANPIYKPAIPCTDNDYAVLMSEAKDLTEYPKGFSLVTNMRLYIGDDFNIVSTTPPTTGLPSPYYPPASLFAPEKRYGIDVDPPQVKIKGQLGHMGGDTGAGGDQVHLLDFKMGSETMANAERIEVNLRPITHPVELPPITMMNWLVVIEERRKEFYTGN